MKLLARKRTGTFLALSGLGTAILVSTGLPAKGADEVSGPLITFQKNGGWCWFQDDRVLMDGETIVGGSVAGATRDGVDAGDINAFSYGTAGGPSSHFEIYDRFQADDHDAPVFLRLPDGRYVVSYASHGGGNLNPAALDGKKADTMMRWRLSARAGDVGAWGPELKAPVGGGVSYTNLYQLSGEKNRIYNFHRTIGFNPNYMFSDDGGKSFTYGGRLLNWTQPDPAIDAKSTPLKPGSGRPYVRYASNNVDEIHFTTTEDHPRHYDNSIYHAYIKGGKIHGSDGKIIGGLSTTTTTAISPKDLTRVFEGSADDVAWTNDIKVGRDGRPIIGFSVQHGDAASRGITSTGGSDLRYYYARWDGARWNTNRVAYAGSALMASGEVDYPGLIAIDGNDPDTVFFSSNANPQTGEPLISAADGQRHREIFQGTTRDGGKNWTFQPITSNSTMDNLRPVVPRYKSTTRPVLWMRGTYGSPTRYDTDIVGILQKVQR